MELLIQLEKEEIKEHDKEQTNNKEYDKNQINKDIIDNINEGNVKIILSIEVNDKKAIACEVTKACTIGGFIQIGIKERLDELNKKDVW